MPRALLSLTKNSLNVSSWSKNLLKFPFISNTLLSINNTKIFQVYNKPLSCTCIRSRLQFLLHKGYIMGPKWRRKMMTDLTLYILLMTFPPLLLPVQLCGNEIISLEVRQKPSILWCGKSLLAYGAACVKSFLACGAACGTNLLSGTKPERLLEVGMGDSQWTRSTQNVRTYVIHYGHL